MPRYDKPLTLEQIATVQDEDIDFSDIPELNEGFWQDAKLVEPDRTEQITLRLKGSVLAYFKASGKGYQTRINRVLESYVQRAQSQASREFQQNLEQFQKNSAFKELERIQQNLEQSPAIKAIREFQQNLEQFQKNSAFKELERIQQNLEQSPAIKTIREFQQNLEQFQKNSAFKELERIQQNLEQSPAIKAIGQFQQNLEQIAESQGAAAKMELAREMLGGVDGARQ